MYDPVISNVNCKGRFIFKKKKEIQYFPSKFNFNRGLPEYNHNLAVKISVTFQ